MVDEISPDRTMDECGAEGDPLPPVAEMIERVASAINHADGFDAQPWDERPQNWQAAYRRMAGAAIEAMRDRNEAMLDAGTAVLWPPLAPMGPGSRAVAVWEAMIDAALGPQVPPPIRDGQP